jgi:L-alanine-DL-glutamate epimerase-like enolase superfamily enzyme
MRFIREHFSPEQVEIRVDANGAFDENEALIKLTQLSEFKLHSIEQPIQKNHTDRMAELCKPVLPVALDEELIGIWYAGKRAIID